MQVLRYQSRPISRSCQIKCIIMQLSLHVIMSFFRIFKGFCWALPINRHDTAM